MRVVVKVTHNTDGDTQVNTFHYDLKNSGIPTDPDNDPQSLADTFRDNVIPHYISRYRESWTIQPVQVIEERDPQNPNAPRQEWISGVPTIGSRPFPGDDELPRACCLVATIRSDHIGRRATGRIFLGGSLTEAEQANGNWIQSTTDTAGALLGSIPLQPDLASGPSDAEAHWVVYSRTNRQELVDKYTAHVIGSQLHVPVFWLRSRQPQ